jgi:hypothetical protein
VIFCGGNIVNPEDVTVAALVPGGPLDVIESLHDHSIDVFMGNGDGTFQAAVGYSTGEYPRTFRSRTTRTTAFRASLSKPAARASGT